MSRTPSILSLLLLLCAGNLRAQVYTIDFNRGTVSGTRIESDLEAEGVTPQDFCSEGADLFTLNDVTQNCRFDAQGCGIRIATGGGRGLFVISLDGKKAISKVVAYASKVPRDTKSTLLFNAANELMCTFANEELPEYSSAKPESENYKLPDIVVNRFVRDLMFQVYRNNLVMLHRIDIYLTDEDAVHLPTESSDGMGYFCNLQGQRVSHPRHGIFIRDGKKVVLH